MCGIVGILAKHGTLPHYASDLFTNMVRMDSIRGEDSTGVFGITSSGHADMMKGDADGYLFTTTKNYSDFYKRISSSYKVVVGHNRKATSGSISAANAHPFRERHILLVHNGVIHNSKKLAETEVDSHAIAHALANHDAVTALGKLDGAYAIVWYDEKDKTINMARNSGRPLFWLEYPSMFVLSSEIGLPYWLNGRDNRKSDKHGIVPVDKIMSFRLDSISGGFTEVPYDEYKTYIAPSNTWKPLQHGYPPIPSEPEKSAKDSAKVLMLPNRFKGDAPLKSGDKIVFEIDDSQKEGAAEVMLGHPVIDGVKHTDVFVRMVLKKNEDPMNYFDTDMAPKLWEGTIQYYRNLLNYPTVFVHDVKLYTIVKDANGSDLTPELLEEALKTPCAKCGSDIIKKADVGESIFRKRSNGTWRVVCKPCLGDAIKQAKTEKPGVELRARTH